MRREWRNVLLALMLFPVGTGIAAARQENAKDAPGSGGEFVHLTLEVSWGMPRNKEGLSGGVREENGSKPGEEFVLELSGGRVIDAVAWPPRESRSNGGAALAEADGGMGPGPNGSWRLGKEPEGRVRVRVEAPLDAVVVVRGGDQPQVTLPLVAILEKPQHTPPQSPLMVSVERLAWDSLVVDLRESAQDGIVAPGSDVPVSVGFNILWPESAEVTVRTTAVLRSIRGGDELGRYEPRDREVVATNRREPSTRIWSVRAPRAEGTYVLEVSASWVSTGVREGSVLGRLIRRRWPAAVPNSAVRRVVFTVVDPATSVVRGSTRRPRPRNRSRHDRPDAVAQLPAAGRRSLPGGGARPIRLVGAARGPDRAVAPRSAAGLDQAHRRRGVQARPGRRIGPGLVGHGAQGRSSRPASSAHAQGQRGRAGGTGRGPDRAGRRRPGSSPRLLLDACASGPPILQDGPPATFNWLVWPSSAEMVLVLLNRSSEAEVRLGMVTLTELDELPELSTLVETQSTAARTFGLYLTGPNPLEPFGGDPPAHDALTTAHNLARYLGYCGAIGRGLAGTTGRPVDAPGPRRPGRRRLDRARSP